MPSAPATDLDRAEEVIHIALVCLRHAFIEHV